MIKPKKRRYGTAADRWAGMGPYYAMFPSTFANEVVAKYSDIGDTVLDPFAGRGTALFSAVSAGRKAIGIELNPVGWIFSKTKLDDVKRCRHQKDPRNPGFCHRVPGVCG